MVWNRTLHHSIFLQIYIYYSLISKFNIQHSCSILSCGGLWYYFWLHAWTRGRREHQLYLASFMKSSFNQLQNISRGFKIFLKIASVWPFRSPVARQQFSKCRQSTNSPLSCATSHFTSVLLPLHLLFGVFGLSGTLFAPLPTGNGGSVKSPSPDMVWPWATKARGWHLDQICIRKLTCWCQRHPLGQVNGGDQNKIWPCIIFRNDIQTLIRKMGA